MSTKEANRVSILEKAIQGRITNQQGGEQIGVSKRHFRRLKKAYKLKGIKGLVHKSRGQESNRKIAQGVKDIVIQEVKEKYPDFGPTLAHEKLSEDNKIDFSVETLRKEMIRVGIWKAKVKKRIKVYQLRERRSQEGELVQADGSPFAWFEDRAPECDLLVYVDDATGKLLWLEFVKSETTEAYFRATRKYLLLHGKPLAFYVDKHSVFRVNTTKVDSASTEDSNGLTQFGRAMKQLDIELIYANTPQAKGRVERVNKTLQDRLVKEMRLRNISSIKEGNKFLPKFIEIYNRKFAVKPKSNVNAHRPLLQADNLEEILCLKHTRVLSKNLTMQYKNKTYQIKVEPGYEYTLRRTRVDVVEKMSGEILIKYKGKKLEYSVILTSPETKIYDSKSINRRIEEIKGKQGRTIQLKLLGRTFLLWTKADISTLA